MSLSKEQELEMIAIIKNLPPGQENASFKLSNSNYEKLKVMYAPQTKPTPDKPHHSALPNPAIL